MAKTVGERCRQEANAQKARGWFRDVQQQAFGCGEYRNSDGTPLKMRYELREDRANRLVERITGAGWHSCDAISFLAIGHVGEHERDALLSMLDRVMHQMPELFTWHADTDAALSFDAVDMHETDAVSAPEPSDVPNWWKGL